MAMKISKQVNRIRCLWGGEKNVAIIKRTISLHRSDTFGSSHNSGYSLGRRLEGHKISFKD